MRLLAFAGLLALTVSAQADLTPSSYSVALNGPPYPYRGGGSLSNGFASIPNVGIVTFSAYLTPTTVNFSFGDSPSYGSPISALQVNTVNFGSQEADFISSFKLDPASTITGIVPSTFFTSLSANPFIPYTNIDFDFSHAAVFPGANATFDLTFAQQTTVPEIEPALACSGLVLLVGTATILRNRHSRLNTGSPTNT